MRDETRSYRGIAVLCIAVALAAAAASAAGLAWRGSGETKTVTSVRGETYEMVIDGVYAYNAQRVVAEGIGWDAVTLFLAVPALLAAAFLIGRGSLRGRLLALGLLAYLFYQYMMYAVYWDIGPLFPLYIVIYPACIAGIAWIVSTVPVGRLPSVAGDSFPRVGMAVLSFIVALVLLGMWSARIAAALSGEIQGVLFGQDTLDVQVFDLGLIVPLAVYTGVQVLRRKAAGYLLSTVLAVKAVTMAAAIDAMLISAWQVEGALEIPPFIFFSAVTIAALWLSIRMFRSLPESRS
jgi:hypothetical protein